MSKSVLDPLIQIYFSIHTEILCQKDPSEYLCHLLLQNPFFYSMCCELLKLKCNLCFEDLF